MAVTWLPIVLWGGSRGRIGAKYMARQPTHATNSGTIGP